MGRRRYRTVPLVLLSATLGFAAGMLAVAGLAAALVGPAAAHLTPWLDPRAAANWLILLCLAVAGIALALLAERTDLRAMPAAPEDPAPVRSVVNVMPDIGDRPAQGLARAA